MTKILLTGGAGFLGSEITRLLLSKGYHVTVLDNGWRNIDNLIPLCNNPLFEFVQGDILNTETIFKLKARVDKVIHLAGIVGEPACLKHFELGRLVNEIGTYNVAIIGRDIPVLFFSTGSVLGQQEKIADENSKPNPVSQYAKSKLVGEDYVFGKMFKNPSTNNIVYRLATVFGLSHNMRMDLLPNDLTYQAWKNKSITIFQADFMRSFIEVQDIASSVLFALENWDSLKGGLYNIANENGNWSKRQLAEFIKSKTGCAVFYGDNDNTYKDTDARNYLMSPNLINSKGWKAKISMEEGIDKLLKALPLLKTDLTYRAV